MTGESIGIPLDLFENAALSFRSGALIEVDAASELLIERDQPGSTPREFEVLSRKFAEFIERKTPFEWREGFVFNTDGSRVDQDTLRNIRLRFEIDSIERLERDSAEPRGLVHKTRGRLIERSKGRDESKQRQIMKPCLFIGSDRLQGETRTSLPARPQARPEWVRAGTDPRGLHAFAVGKVKQSLISIISNAREHARKESERLDNDYFKRFLATIRSPTVARRMTDEDALRNTERRLVKCALATSKLDLPDIDIAQFDPAERRVIEAAYSLYLADLSQKSSVSARLLDKLEFFLDLLNAHFNGKTAALSLEDGLNVKRNSDSLPIPLHRLSSGEQHLIVLFHAILFETADDGICLIDEPEISLNVDWQLRFVDSLRRAAQLVGANQQFVIATHSPTLVGDHDDCCLEFGRA
jgi:hypothetical protein